MNGTLIGRLARLLVLVGILALGGVSLTAPSPSTVTPVAYAGVSQRNDNNDDRTDDDSEDRNLKGQVIELYGDLTPPEALVAQTGGNVWARIYNDQLRRNGLNVGDHVTMRGEYDHGIFQAYSIDIDDRCCGGPNGNGNDNK